MISVLCIQGIRERRTHSKLFIQLNGGTIIMTGSSSFDYDGSAEYNGGTIIVNGQQINYIPNQMMGGGRGGMGGWGRRG